MGTTKSISSSIALTDPPLVPVTQTAPLVTTTQTAIASESHGRHTGSLPPPQSATETAKQTRTISPAFLVFEGPIGSPVQPQPSPESSPDDAQISLSLLAALLWLARLLLLPLILSFWSLMPKGEREYVDLGGAL
jgi:hypothetical protein